MMFKHGKLELGGIRFNQASPFVEYSLDGISHYTQPADAKKEADGKYYTLLGYADRHKFVFYNSDIVLMLAVDYLHDKSGVIINVAVKNNTNSDIKIKRIGLASINHIDYMGDASEWVLSGITHAPKNGTLHETFSTPGAKPGTRKYDDFISLYNRDGRGIVMGPYSRPEADLVFECDIINGIMSLNIVSEMTNITLESGETRDAQSVVILHGKHYECYNRIFYALSRTHGRRTNKSPVCGWTSRYCMGNNPDSKSVVRASEASDMLGVSYIGIDSGYQKSYGNWNANSEFGTELEDTAKKINENGAVAGIWLAPLYVSDSYGMYGEHPEYFQHKENGECFYETDEKTGEIIRPLDPTVPQVQDYISKIIQSKVDEGFKMLKIDYTDLHPDAKYFDNRLTRLQIMRNLYKLYRTAAGENTTILASTGGIERGVFGFADFCRTGNDSCIRLSDGKSTGAVWQSDSSEATMLEALRCAGQASIANRHFFSNHLDLVFLENSSFINGKSKRAKATVEEITTWNTFAGLSGGCVSVSHPIWNPTPEEEMRRFEILNPPYESDAFAAKAGYDTDFTQYGFYWDRSFGISSSFMVWNNTDKPKKASIDNVHLTSLGGDFHLWSFWDEKYLGKGIEKAEKITLKPHGCALFKATVISDDMAPAFIGSTLHISMGAKEVEKYIFGIYGCKFELNTHGAQNGALYVYSKKPLKLTEFKNVCAELSSPQKNIYKITLTKRSKTENQIIKLEY